jgi:hypothetical protein
MATIIRLAVCFAAAAGTYFLLGSHFPTINHFAFGVAGVGVTWLALASGATGLVAAKLTS